MRKPKGCIYPNCLKCPLPECEYDGIEPSDVLESQRRDMKAREFKYGKSLLESQAKALAKYERTEKAKIRKRRYEQSEKGKAKYRRYYERHKDEILAKAKAKRAG